MTQRNYPIKMRTEKAQAGIVLPLVMIFLVIMTLIGIAAIRNVTMEEKMAGNSRYQQLAFQSAEDALRECERDVMDPARAKFFKDQVALELTEVPAAGTQWDPASSNNKWHATDYVSTAATVANRYNKSVTLSGAANGLMTARCMVEKLTATPSKQPGTLPHCPFRVTARVQDTDSNTVTLLQSYLIAPLNSKNICAP